jgi:hypothetical protein
MGSGKGMLFNLLRTPLSVVCLRASENSVATRHTPYTEFAREHAMGCPAFHQDWPADSGTLFFAKVDFILGIALDLAPCPVPDRGPMIEPARTFGLLRFRQSQLELILNHIFHLACRPSAIHDSPVPLLPWLASVGVTPADALSRRGSYCSFLFVPCAWPSAKLTVFKWTDSIPGMRKQPGQRGTRMALISANVR